jgi:meiotic recombination protein REC8
MDTTSDANIPGDGTLHTLGTSDLTFSKKGDTSSEWVESLEEQEQAAHRLRAARTKKALPVDRTLELRNRDINGSGAHYAELMLAAEKERISRSIPYQAKKNAYHWILGVGLNGIGTSIYGLRNPLHMFTGTELYDMIGRTLPVATDRKRGHDSDEDGGEAARNVRTRLEDDGNLLGDDAVDVDDSNIEVAREAGKELTDVSSVMPWNTASFRGSSVGRGSVLGAPPASATRAPGSGRRSLAPLRLLSTSPVVPGSIDRHSVTLGDEAFQLVHDADLDDSGAVPANAPGLQHSWQTTDGSQLRETDEIQFLAFVEAGVEKKQLDERHTAVRYIDFEELLDPVGSNRAVAAQALIHVLSLATRASLIVEQAEHFGRIRMQVT